MVRVANRWLSVDPYMRGRMNDVKSYVPPFALDAPMEGGAVGEVVESQADGFAPGDLVLHMAGWRDEAVLPAQALNKLPDLGVEPQAFLGNLGLTGGTAYFGLLEAASGQGRRRGLRLRRRRRGRLGGGPDRQGQGHDGDRLGRRARTNANSSRSLGADAVVDYKAQPILKGLAAAAPDGIDVYFDNVGGDHLDAAFALARKDARFAICGMIEGYNAAEPMCFRFIMRVIAMRIRVQGFIYTDYLPRMGEFHRDMGGWIAGGQVKARDTVVEGLEKTPDAFLGLFTGKNTGKMLVKL